MLVPLTGLAVKVLLGVVESGFLVRLNVGHEVVDGGVEMLPREA